MYAIRSYYAVPLFIYLTARAAKGGAPSWVRRLVFTAVAAGIVITPVMVRNWVVGHALVPVAASGGVNFATTYAWIIVLLAVVWFLPNSVEVLAPYNPALNIPDRKARPGWVERHLGIWTWTSYNFV